MKPNPRKIAEEYLRYTWWEVSIYGVLCFCTVFFACGAYGGW